MTISFLFDLYFYLFSLYAPAFVEWGKGIKRCSCLCVCINFEDDLLVCNFSSTIYFSVWAITLTSLDMKEKHLAGASMSHIHFSSSLFISVDKLTWDFLCPQFTRNWGGILVVWACPSVCPQSVTLPSLCPPPKGRGTYCFWCRSCWRRR